MPVYNDYPLQEICDGANDVLEDSKGTARVYFKWTCQGCGERVTANKPNVFYTSAAHDDCKVKPGFVSDTQASGGNFLIMQAQSQAGSALIRKIMGDDEPAVVTIESMGPVDGSVRREALKRHGL